MPKWKTTTTFALCAALLGACGGEKGSGPPTPAPSAETPREAITFGTGTGHVEVTAPEPQTFDAPLDVDEGNEFDPVDGEAGLTFQTEDGRGLQVTLYFGRGPFTGEVDAFIAVVTGDDPTNDRYVDFIHTECTVLVESFSDAGVEGSFDCPGLPSFVEDGVTIDARGTFSAAP